MNFHLLYRLFALLATLVILPGCYPISNFTGQKAFCLWNLSAEDVVIQNPESHHSVTLAPRSYIVMKRPDKGKVLVSIKLRHKPMRQIDLRSKTGSYELRYGVHWMHLVILQDGDVHEIDPDTSDSHTLEFETTVINHTTLRKNWFE